MLDSIRDRIKAKLDESFISVKNDFRNQKSNLLNLTHMGHGTYKNPAGHEFTWDESKHDFILTKKAEIKPSNVLQFPDLNQKNGRTRGDHPENPTTPKDNEQINKFYKQQQVINKDKRDLEPKLGKIEDPNKDIGFDPFSLLKKSEPKSMFNNPPPGGWTDADKVPLNKQTPKDYYKTISNDPDEISGNPDSYVDKDLQNSIKSFASKFKEAIKKYHKDSGYDGEVFDKDKKVKIKYKNKWANIDHGEGAGKFMIALDDITDRSGTLVAKKGDVREIKAYGVPNHRWKLGNVLTGTYKANFHGGSFESNKNLEQIKDQIKAKLEDPNTGYEIDDVSEDPKDHRRGKLVSKNWALKYNSTYGDVNFDIYENPENIGRRGKTVKQTHMSAYLHDTQAIRRTLWGATIYGRIKEAKPKTAKDLINFIENQYKEMKSEEPKTVIYPSREDEMKGIDKQIPDFGLEGEYENIKGGDTFVQFSKPDIVISSDQDEKRFGGFSHPQISIKWHNAKKLNKVKDQLKNAVGLDAIIKILNDNGIKHRYTNYTDAQFT